MKLIIAYVYIYYRYARGISFLSINSNICMKLLMKYFDFHTITCIFAFSFESCTSSSSISGLDRPGAADLWRGRWGDDIGAQTSPGGNMLFLQCCIYMGIWRATGPKRPRTHTCMHIYWCMHAIDDIYRCGCAFAVIYSNTLIFHSKYTYECIDVCVCYMGLCAL